MFNHRRVSALTAALFTITCQSPAQAGPLNLDLNLASVHTKAWARRSLNQNNPGVGVTYRMNRTWAVAGGGYWNSYRRPTLYAIAEFTPLHLGTAGDWHLDAGFAGGLASGYRREEVSCAPLIGAGLLRIAAPSGVGANVMIAPGAGNRSGFVGLQVFIPLR